MTGFGSMLAELNLNDRRAISEAKPSELTANVYLVGFCPFEDADAVSRILRACRHHNTTAAVDGYWLHHT